MQINAGADSRRRVTLRLRHEGDDKMRSDMRSRCKTGFVIAASALLVGCASTPGVMLPDGTLLLGEVRHSLSREMLNAGEIAPGRKRDNLAELIRSRGWTDAQIDQGRVVVIRDLIYWINTASGIKHEQLQPELLAEGLSVEPGNIVELTVGARSGAVVRVRARDLNEGGCYYSDLPVAAAVELMGALSLVGPRGSASLYCAGIEREGWQRPRTYWHKLPDAAAGSREPPRTPPPDMPH